MENIAYIHRLGSKTVYGPYRMAQPLTGISKGQIVDPGSLGQCYRVEDVKYEISSAGVVTRIFVEGQPIQSE